MADLTGIDPNRVEQLAASENARFVAERPRSMELWERARRSMPRGVPMAWMDDLYEHPPAWVASGEGATFTMSGFCGHAPAAVVKAVSDRVKRGSQFLLPDEDAIVVAEHLAERYRLPKWQFTPPGPKRTPRWFASPGR
jgi:glutamate-1-semialdehyde 2,1-aminomutase